MGWKKYVYKTLYFLGGLALDALINWFDTNNDGKVDRDEFKDGARRISDKAKRLLNKSK